MSGRRTALELGLAAALLVVLVAPFAGRPFNIDEPVYVWCAQWIADHPLDFYGFAFNWTGEQTPAYASNENPPLSSYSMAAAAALLGWDETRLHLAFLLAGLGAVTGTYFLASRMTERPLIAALATSLCPAFLATSSLANSDMMMVAFFVWALYWWDRGLEDDDSRAMLAAGLLAALAALTKYFGLALIPLMAAHAVARRAPLLRSCLSLAIAPAAITLYHFVTLSLYGESLVLSALGYASGYRDQHAAAWLSQLVLGLTFLGGCCATVAALAPALRPRWTLVVAAILVAAAGGAWSLSADLGPAHPAGVPGAMALQIGLWTGVGLGVIALVASDLAAQRDARALLLALWVVGTVYFTTFVNWTTNGRSVLPLIPAVGILLARRLDRVASDASAVWLRSGLAAAAALALAVQWADVRCAESARRAAEDLVPRLVGLGEDVWFQGHWGFQFYAEPLGAQALDKRESRVREGDRVIVPIGNSYLFPLPAAAFEQESVYEAALAPWISTMSPAAGSGFYAATYGPLPFAFAFGSVEPARYAIYRVTAAYDFALSRTVPARTRGGH